MKKVTFKELTLTKIEKTFGLSQVWKSSILEEWENMSAEITESEKDFLEVLRDRIQKGGKAWNETELENKFISPLITFSKIDTDEFGYFLERPLQASIGEYELTGIVDGMIATGIREPDIPFFCLHEYKRSVDNEGNPDAQALAAMLVAREQNGNNKPIYGLYIVGLIWNFIVLNENEYCISKDYNSSQEEIYDIFRMMKTLKIIIQTKLL
ncbi:MAG: hypothetical protein EAZ08_02795 [Cytophagales bacterium]|nr:MAG: hypothetical protein EAZ08_02795 [Cytophagales bacterium]